MTYSRRYKGKLGLIHRAISRFESVGYPVREDQVSSTATTDDDAHADEPFPVYPRWRTTRPQEDGDLTSHEEWNAVRNGTF